MSGSNVSGQIGNHVKAITPSDTAQNAFSYIYVGTGGDVKVTDELGNVATFTAAPQGGYLWVRTSLVWATGTTASNLVGHR